MEGQFGSMRAQTVARDHVFSALGGRTAVDALELPPLYEGTLWDYMERAALSMVNSPSAP